MKFTISALALHAPDAPDGIGKIEVYQRLFPSGRHLVGSATFEHGAFKTLVEVEPFGVVGVREFEIWVNGVFDRVLEHAIE
jgi:hypothetical protein